MNSRIKLRVIEGGKSRAFRVGPVSITCISPDSHQPPEMPHILEEDTWQVLSADPAIREVFEHPIRIMTDLIDQKPLSPGDVVCHNNCWQVVIYDFDQEPVCKKKWIELAMRHLWQRTEEYQQHELAMPILGTVHGCLHWSESLEIMTGTLRSESIASLKKIWLLVPEEILQDIQQWLMVASNRPGRTS